jgi:acyl carrier protein
VTSVEIKTKLRDYICRELIRDPHYPLGDDERLITGGLMDSFSLAQLGVFIETAFGVYIPDTDLTVENMETLNRMVKRITQDIKPA